MFRSSRSHYIKTDTRLADVVSAIQAMGSYKFYKRSFAGWSQAICGDENQKEYWETIILEHPEFFRLNTEKDKASLVWRRNYPRNYHVDRNKVLTDIELNELSEADHNSRVSRMPLSSDDISVLINTAINLHSRQLERKKDKLWWRTSVIGIAGVVVGALLKSWLDPGG